MVDRQSSQWLGRLGRRKLAVAVCGLVCGLSLTASAAEPPAADEPARAKGDADSLPAMSGPERRELGYILLGTSCALGAGMVGIFLYIRRRRREQALFEFDADAFARKASARRRRTPLEASASRVERSADNATVGAETVLEALGDSQVGFAAHASSVQGRECPKCSRTYPSTILVCPYDSSPLRDRRKKRRRSARASKAGRLDRQVCSGCDRRYANDVDYCYHDGLPLAQDTRERAHDAPTFKACEECGWEAETDEALCPHDGSELVEIDASDSTRIAPTIPMMICPKCREYGAPGVAFCPNDGELLTPLTNVRMTEFPAHGFGPRRKVCEECGAEHSGHASYCSHDGAQLVALN